MGEDKGNSPTASHQTLDNCIPVNKFTTHRFNCGGASIDLGSYGITAKDDQEGIELTGIPSQTLHAAIVSYVYAQEWADRDSRQPDDFLEALIAKATEALRTRQERREKASN